MTKLIDISHVVRTGYDAVFTGDAVIYVCSLDASFYVLVTGFCWANSHARSILTLLTRYSYISFIKQTIPSMMLTKARSEAALKNGLKPSCLL